MRVDLPKGKYFKKIEVNDNGLDIEFGERKKIALLFVCLNPQYWPYLSQVIKDCRQHFLPQHKINYFIWTDFNKDTKERGIRYLDAVYDNFQKAEPDKKQNAFSDILNVFAVVIRQYEPIYPKELQDIISEISKQGIVFKREGEKYWIESVRSLNDIDARIFYESAKKILELSNNDVEESLRGAKINEAEGVEWPAPTLMRYHLFLQEEEALKDYDYIFYMDADMRVVSKISDEILGDGLTAAEHPMYSLRKEYVPPYEPNLESTAYIKRPGAVIVEDGKPRFKPYYYAGGFQGGVASHFLEAMRVMKKNIDKDFDRNYIAIWNDESHWNKYLFEYEGSLIVLPPSYVYPDSLINEYYVKVWGKNYEPKIITLTKPFTTSTEGGAAVNKFINQ